MDLEKIVQHNCNISDARDSGIYSLCTMILKLRNLYKWEKGLEPWDEPEPAEILDWIEGRENYWDSIVDEEYGVITINGNRFDPFDLAAVNEKIKEDNLVYGAGYGRSLKSVFFLAELLEESTADGCPVLILGRELAREMASPFAMLQDGAIIIRRESLRFFFWDQVQEIRSTSRPALKHALELHGCWKDDRPDRQLFRKNLDRIVDREIPSFIHHETGEYHEKGLDSTTLKTIVATFPASAIELVARGIKDILADTNDKGMLGYIIKNRVETSLAFYVGFLDGLRKLLTPEISAAFPEFLKTRDWSTIENARQLCRERNLQRGAVLQEACAKLKKDSAESVKCFIEKKLLKPLNL
ncbi:MAG: hypothetical protein KKG35_07555 [Proteobacteria bacterium]|nr:hypothetical protein [Pseudomonadota bacterium]